MIVFGADHIYRMNIAHMIAEHQRTGASCTVAAIPVHKKHAHEFGVIEVARDNRILAFHEKNPNSPSIPGAGPEAHMGYLVNLRYETADVSFTMAWRAHTASQPVVILRESGVSSTLRPLDSSLASRSTGSPAFAGGDG